MFFLPSPMKKIQKRRRIQRFSLIMDGKQNEQDTSMLELNNLYKKNLQQTK